jgi:hypothetical protein
MIPCLKQLQHEAGNSSASHTKVQNAYDPIAILLYIFMVWVLYSGNLTYELNLFMVVKC